MKAIILLLVVLALFFAGCQEAVDRGNNAVPQEIQESENPITEEAKISDDYSDIQTAQDDFNALDEALGTLV